MLKMTTTIGVTTTNTMTAAAAQNYYNGCHDDGSTHLKAHRDGRTCPFLGFTLSTEQLHLSTQLTLLHASHTLDSATVMHRSVNFLNT